MFWACTVHKVQGLSLSEVVVNFDLKSDESFNQGQIYVALSRITSVNKLYLIGKYNKATLKANVPAKKENERLRIESLFKPHPDFLVTESTIARSLKKISYIP